MAKSINIYLMIYNSASLVVGGGGGWWLVVGFYITRFHSMPMFFLVVSCICNVNIALL